MEDRTCEQCTMGDVKMYQAETQAQAVGDLYGQRFTKTGRIVNADTAPRKKATKIVMTFATTSSRVQSRMTMPARNRTMAISRSAGMALIVAVTFHSSHASNRTCLTRTFSRGKARGEFHCMYSRSHCLPMMPNRAAAREKTRLMKNRQLIQRADVGGTKVVEDSREFIVSLRTGGMGL